MCDIQDISPAGSTEPDVAHNFSPLVIIYKDGRAERLVGNEIVPTSVDPESNVLSKDVVYSQEENLSSRLFLPNNINPNKKLPLLIYYHGGGFCVETPFSPTYHSYVNMLVAESQTIAISVDYRRTPEHPIPILYDDSWTAIKWAAFHVNGDGPEEWLNSHADFNRVFFAGDSAGANIAHHMAMRYSEEKLFGVNLVGNILMNPFFWGEESIGNEVNEQVMTREQIKKIWHLASPTTSGCDDPLINPIMDPKLLNLGGTKVLVIVAEKDFLRDRGWLYYEALKNNGWGGRVEIMEVKEEGHVFHLSNPACENAVAMLRKIVSFIHEE
ncbi:unnamed protein product [Dovyalis caffra]|uniref:Alpha/beta hydrolase fold-3 domain-containing protein n=1 Tax=Dovyalis caffra TaxID=77055 RepID=A0AAV1R7S0_9ROSI|nr:unnamed protein product [Dovyalis caffra]